jgi:hypothetical protein
LVVKISVVAKVYREVIDRIKKEKNQQKGMS